MALGIKAMYIVAALLCGGAALFAMREERARPASPARQSSAAAAA